LDLACAENGDGGAVEEPLGTGNESSYCWKKKDEASLS